MEYRFDVDLMRRRWLWLGLALLVTALSAGVVATRGVNPGIDFTGGTLLERGFPEAVPPAELRQLLQSPELAALGAGKAVIQPLEDPRHVLLRLPELGPEEIGRLDTALTERYGQVEERRTEVVGPVIGAELIRRALLALGLGLGAVLVYITVRFEFRFAVAAVVALVHDVLLSLAAVSLAGFEVNTPFVAAILTVVGYSLNDTIIVFDRIRENLRTRQGKEEVAALANRSILETLPRSVNTSLTTLLTLVALYLFGGVTLRDLVLTLMVGIAAGTYSSIFIASTLWVVWRERGEGHGRGRSASLAAAR